MESKFAPIAQLLVYTILPNEEVVADTEKLDIENRFANEVGVLFSSSPLFEQWKNKELIMFIKRLSGSAPKTSAKGSLTAENDNKT